MCTLYIYSYSEKREIIRSGQHLQSEQIRLAVQLIREKQGLLCTLLLRSPNKVPKQPRGSIQIHHVGGNHWVCSMNEGTHVKHLTAYTLDTSPKT